MLETDPMLADAWLGRASLKLGRAADALRQMKSPQAAKLKTMMGR